MVFIQGRRRGFVLTVTRTSQNGTNGFGCWVQIECLGKASYDKASYDALGSVKEVPYDTWIDLEIGLRQFVTLST